MSTKKNSTKSLKISVITPTYNRASEIVGAINSVYALPASLLHEHIIVDDGSTDNTSKVIHEHMHPKLKYFQLDKNQGVNAARNKAIIEATGNYVLLLDSDDILSENAASILSKHHKDILAHKVIMLGTARIDTNQKMFNAVRQGEYDYSQWLSKNDLSGEFIGLIESKAAKKNPFDERRWCFEEVFWNRIISKHGLYVIPEVIRLYSFEAENRVSKKLVSPSAASKRVSDYEHYLDEFEKDFLTLNAQRALSEKYFSTALFAKLAGKNRKARRYAWNSFLLAKSFKNFSLVVLTILPKSLFTFIYKIVLKGVQI